VYCPWMSPHILRGASNSRRIGWERKISRDLRQRPRTSASASWTVFPGRPPARTSSSREMILSTFNSSAIS